MWPSTWRVVLQIYWLVPIAHHLGTLWVTQNNTDKFRHDQLIIMPQKVIPKFTHIASVIRTPSTGYPFTSASNSRSAPSWKVVFMSVLRTSSRHLKTSHFVSEDHNPGMKPLSFEVRRYMNTRLPLWLKITYKTWLLFGLKNLLHDKINSNINKRHYTNWNYVALWSYVDTFFTYDHIICLSLIYLGHSLLPISLTIWRKNIACDIPLWPVTYDTLDADVVAWNLS